MIPLLVILLLSTMCSAQSRLYIVQYSDESLAQITLADETVNSHVLDLGYGCNDIIADGTRLYVTNSLLNTVQEIDAEANVTIRSIPTSGGINPYSAAIINSDTLAVTNWLSNNVLLIRLSDGTIAANIPVGIAPQGILTHGDEVYVCLTRYLSFGTYGPGVVFIFTRNTFELIDSLQVGINPQFAAVDGNNRLHVICTGDYDSIVGEVYVVDLANRETAAVLPLGGNPSTVSFGGGYACLAAGGWGDQGFVERYRLDDLSIINDSNDPLLTGSGATDVEVITDGSYFVSCSSEDIVNYHDVSGRLIRSFLVSDGPGQMVMYWDPNAVNPQANQAIPSLSDILQVYPNPFNSVVRIELNVPTKRHSNIIIYNILGSVIDRLQVSPGVKSIEWSPGNYPTTAISSGVYIAVWSEGGGGNATKIVYIQ